MINSTTSLILGTLSHHLRYHPRGVKKEPKNPFQLQKLLHFLSCNRVDVRLEQELLQLQHSWQTGAPDLYREVNWADPSFKLTTSTRLLCNVQCTPRTGFVKISGNFHQNHNLKRQYQGI